MKISEKKGTQLKVDLSLVQILGFTREEKGISILSGFVFVLTKRKNFRGMSSAQRTE